ncbi:MAG: mechanosensitive ion channel family protein [Aliidiomarina sp.]|uniref:mechanosensitive ion channel domain-containing protein n=1 Tax=Aliidiomarina sp. TaxID=1872439 RepID=UPI0025B7FFE9|nr:mechanosensitive ion channel domain-containing protein [Aliidiomarina sp.]MCH8500499.1 mechanosensitive ion channel family protein [Aliidiomarina sp.]
MEFWTDFFASFEISRSTARLIASSVVLIAGVSILRFLLGRFIRKSVNSSELRQRWLVQSRNGLLLILLLGLMMIWATELRTFALSIVAIAVAFVVATKELILCLTGSIVKSAGSSFNIGDRIQVKDFRGDVVDQNLLTTTLLEVGPGKLSHQRTGRMTVIPNALFVSEAVINESYTHDWVLHVFTVPFKREENWKLAKQAILDTANQYCAPYLEDVRRYMKKKSEQRGLESPSVDPRVTLQVATAGEIHLVVRIPVKAGQRSFIEQSILTDVFVNYNFAPAPAVVAPKTQEPDSSKED